MTSESEFSQSVCDALLRDEELVHLLGSLNVFEGYETKASTAHINVCESASEDEWLANNDNHEAVVTLQVWSHSGKSSRALDLLNAAEQALLNAGLLEPGSKILLQRDFAGARKIPHSGQFQGILRYHAENCPNAA